ncbi:MAG: CHASE2 domain-containing protein [Chitinophagaceae bacterium]|nr:CHASE2 domain-containing protein [Chitinophagaceae bacterium]
MKKITTRLLLLNKKTIIYSLIISLFTWLFTFLIHINIKALTIIDTGLDDVDLTDIVYSRSSKSTNSIHTIENKNIVLINSGDLKRYDLARLLSKLEEYQVRVIGIDIIFKNLVGNLADTLLADVISKNDNLVFATLIEDQKKMMVKNSNSFFKIKAEGYTNFYNLKDSLSVVREFKSYIYHKKDTLHSFALSIVKKIDPISYNKMIKCHKKGMLINYSGNENNFIILEGDSILHSQRSFEKELYDKVVLVGKINTTPNSKNSTLEDRFYTPMNSIIFGKSYPDASGLIIQANILSMILDGKYIKKSSNLFNLITVLIITYLVVTLFLRIEHYYRTWHHIIIKILQIIFSIIVVLISILIYENLRFKFNTGFLLTNIIISAEMLSLIHAVEKSYFNPLIKAKTEKN